MTSTLVRRALDLDRIALYGDSYGTFLGQVYAFRHPETLDALVLDGAYPVRGESPWYPSLITTGNEAFVTACDRAPSCPPGAARRLGRMAELMREKGMDVGELIDALAGGAYSPPESYLAVERAGRALLAGKPAAWRRLTLNEIVAGRDRFSYDRAMELVVGCNDYPMIWDREATEEERRAQLEESIGSYDPKAFMPFTPREVALSSENGYLECLTWPQPTALREPPIRAGMEPTEAPVLVVNGELDDLTTPFEGGLVAGSFPDARQFIGRDAGPRRRPLRLRRAVGPCDPPVPAPDARLAASGQRGRRRAGDAHRRDQQPDRRPEAQLRRLARPRLLGEVEQREDLGEELGIGVLANITGEAGE